MVTNPTLKDIRLYISEDIEITNLPSHIKALKNQYENKPLTNHEISNVCLFYGSKGISLVESKDDKISRELLYIDFINGKNGFRHAQNCTIKQPLAKAVGIKPGFRPTVFDATAGLGGDGFVLACLGCTVFLCERSSILSVLLKDALIRAVSHPHTSEIVTNGLHLITEDSIQALDNVVAETIYLDPMYPHRTKSALNKKEMRIIREIVGDDEDSDILLDKALNIAKNRVVVKRPKGAPYLKDNKPSYEVKMKNSRFDIYLT